MKKTKIFMLLLVLSTSLHLASAQTAREVARMSITVNNLAASSRFYQEVLQFEPVGSYQLPAVEVEKIFGMRANLEAVTLRLGQEYLELLAFSVPGRAIPSDSRSNDRWFQHVAIVVRDMAAAYQRLRTAKVQFVSTAPQTLPAYLPAAAGISAFYFQDPDGHNLEIIHFPPGKGDPRWQQAGNDLFQGIDHTAIGIDDTERSTAFYRDLLGLQVAGNSENYGSEQEHLNQVFGAHLLITGLRAQQGPGLEFLDYLAPPGGRPYPTGSRANDLWHWHTNLFLEEGAWQRWQTQAKPARPPAHLNHPVWGKIHAVLIRDPDGHALLVMTRG